MFYQESKTAKAAVIGTIIPWTGSLSNIPDGWIICDGSRKNAADYPLLVQAIGDTYNAGTSNLGGQFPNYTGEIVLPSLNNKVVMDIEESYFASRNNGGTGKSVDLDNDARSIISPYIGDNTDNGIPTIYNDVYTDVIFTLNDRTGYSGRITGNVMVPGSQTKTIFIGGRKLGTTHIRSHGHSGSYETLAGAETTLPGKGVVPWDNIRTTWQSGVADVIPNFGTRDSGAKYYFKYEIREKTWSDVENRSGFGSGAPGRVLARVASEQPPYNLSPKNVLKTPIQVSLMDPKLDSGDVIPYGISGSNITVPTGFRNYDAEYPALGNFGTLVSNPQSTWQDNSFLAHNHDPIDVEFDTAGLKPPSSLNASVSIPSTTTLDNNSNIGALQINMNTTQPSLTCIYIIRAY